MEFWTLSGMFVFGSLFTGIVWRFHVWLNGHNAANDLLEKAAHIAARDDTFEIAVNTIKRELIGAGLSDANNLDRLALAITTSVLISLNQHYEVQYAEKEDEETKWTASNA